MGDVNVHCYSVGVKEKTSCEITLKNVTNTNIISFNSDKFLFNILLKDSVDVEDLHNLLNKKEKKIILECNLDKDNKKYKGPRKIVWRNNNIAVSQGGIRLEFDNNIQNKIFNILTLIKEIT